MSRLDELLRQARDAEPDPLHPVQVDRIVSHAAVAGRGRHRGWVLRRVTGVAAVSAALAAAGLRVERKAPTQRYGLANHVRWLTGRTIPEVGPVELGYRWALARTPWSDTLFYVCRRA